MLTLDSCGLLCSTLRRFITSQHDVGARRDFVFSFLGLELELSRQKSSFILYLRPPPPPYPSRSARTLCTMIIIYMTCLHHVSQLDPLDLNRTRTRARTRPSFYFLFVLIGSDIAFFIVSWSLLTPSPVPPSACLLARSHVYPYLPGPARVFFSASSRSVCSASYFICQSHCIHSYI